MKEAWGALENDQDLTAFQNGKKVLHKMLKGIDVRAFYFGTLTKDNIYHIYL